MPIAWASYSRSMALEGKGGIFYRAIVKPTVGPVRGLCGMVQICNFLLPEPYILHTLIRVSLLPYADVKCVVAFTSARAGGFCIMSSKEYRQAYYQAHKAEIKAYREARREEISTNKREYREAHKAEINARHKKYQQAHKAELNLKQREYREAHKAEINARRRGSPQQRTANNHNRRARKLHNGGTHTTKDIQTQYQRQKGKCYYCKVKLGKAYHVDHVIPLSKGGSNGPENLVIACPSCNLSKRNKLLHEWLEGGRLL